MLVVVVVVLLRVGLWLGCCFCLCWLFGLGGFVDCWYELDTFFVFCYCRVFGWFVGWCLSLIGLFVIMLELGVVSWSVVC